MISYRGQGTLPSTCMDGEAASHQMPPQCHLRVHAVDL